jgi:UDP-N-acetyl-D-mannosaminuronic acid dehydrogenase
MPESTEAGVFDVAIVGGLGHVGLPLGLAFAEAGLRTCLYDVDPHKAEMVGRGVLPFIEYDAEPVLRKVLADRTLSISLDPAVVGQAEHVVVAIGTPVDEYLNPKTRQFFELFSKLGRHLHSRQTIIIRSTVYPRTCQQLASVLPAEAGPWHIAYCPERIVQGYAVRELKQLPQIVSGLTQTAVDNAARLFQRICPRVIRASIEEAELVKLFSNTWRYIQFAVANQFYMIANDFGVDFNEVRKVMTDGYGRAASLPGAGFAAGPCLLKDTLQLAAFNNNRFFLGHAAMLVNEGLPNYLVEELRRMRDLAKTTVGILGMAFKADIDDTRDSLSYKLGKVLRFHGARVLYSDEFAHDPTFVPKEELVAASDVVIVGVPHSAYRQLAVPPHVHLVDLWGVVPARASEEVIPLSRRAA